MAHSYKRKDIVLQVLSFVAENERSNIKQRQAEGIAIAKARGVRFGRPPKPLPSNFYKIYQKWKEGKITGVVAADACGMPVSTFLYKARAYEKVVKYALCDWIKQSEMHYDNLKMYFISFENGLYSVYLPLKKRMHSDYVMKNKKEEKLQKGVLFCNFFSFFYNIILQILYSITSKNSIYKNKKE